MSTSSHLTWKDRYPNFVAAVIFTKRKGVSFYEDLAYEQFITSYNEVAEAWTSGLRKHGWLIGPKAVSIIDRSILLVKSKSKTIKYVFICNE